MKIPSVYTNKKTASQYAQAFKKVPFDKLPFVLHSLSSYPDIVLKELAPLLSLRLYPVRHDPRFSKYTAVFVPYLFKKETNPAWEKWFHGLTGEKQEEECMLSLISKGILKEEFDKFPTLIPALKGFVEYTYGPSSNRTSKELCKEGNEKILQHAMRLASVEVNTGIMRELSLRTTPLPSSFIKNFPASSVDFKDILTRYGLIKSLWHFPDFLCQSLTSEYIRQNVFSLITPKIYQTQYSKEKLNEKDRQTLTEFYRCLFKKDIKAQDFFFYTLRHPQIPNEFFYFSLVEAASEEDLKAVIPLWQKREDDAFLKLLEHPSVVRCMIKDEITNMPSSKKARKM